jgi:serine protease Do
MKLVKVLWLLGAFVCLTAVAAIMAPAVSGQSRGDRRVELLREAGARIGAAVRDLEPGELKEGTGVYIESVRPGGPAANAGLQAADILVRFDAESVRSVRQLTRLVQETPAGRPVKVAIFRGGKATELSLTPEPGRFGNVIVDGERIRAMIDEREIQEQLSELQERLSQIPRDLDSALAGLRGRSRLGVTIEELTPQLAVYFGVKDGVLITAVGEETPASRAGLKAGDVIVSIGEKTVNTASDLVRELRSAGSNAEVTIRIVRDKREETVKARLEERRESVPPRPVRPIGTRRMGLPA